MKRIYLFGIILGIVFIGACKKGKADFTLTGTITDTTFDLPLSGASIKLYATEAGELTQDLIASGTLDSQGNYSFTFPREQIETYHILVEKTNYFEIYKDIPFSSLSIEDDNVFDYTTTAKSWVKFNIKNQNPDPSDVFEYARQEGKINCTECCPSGSWFFYGDLDTTFYCVNDGNAIYSGYYWVQGGTDGPIWVETPAFDTVEVTIDY